MTKLAIVCVAAFIAGAAAAKYWWPTVQTRTEVQTQEVVRNDIRTVTRTIVKQDGSQETVQETIDKSQRSDTSKSVAVVTARKDWFVALSIGSQILDPKLQYGLHVNRRILGPAYVGAYGRTDGELGLQIGLEF